MFDNTHIFQNGWLAFELNVLRRLKFKSVVFPFAGKVNLGAALKGWNVRVSANDAMRAVWTKCAAEIENNVETLSGEDVEVILEDAYVPRYHLQNNALRDWFGEIDAWWLDNIRQNIEKLPSPLKKACALKIGMNVGDYALSFAEDARDLRQPLSKIFKQFRAVEPKPFDNNQKNVCTSRAINEFIAESHSDLMFLRLPRARNLPLKDALGKATWREEWIRGDRDFWTEAEAAQTGKLGARVNSKSQYLRHLEDFLQSAAHIPQWTIAHAEDNFITTPDIIEIVNRIRRVETVFTKDFSELTGAKAVIITA